MEACTEKHQVQDTKMVRRLLGNNFRFSQRVLLAAYAKLAGRVNRRRRDEAAAKNEDHEGCNEED